jgi:hypothetical protein
VTEEQLQFALEAATRIRTKWNSWLLDDARARSISRLLHFEDLRFLRWGSRALYRPGQEGNPLVAARAISLAAGQALNNLPLVGLMGLDELESFGGDLVGRMIQQLPALQLGIGAVRALAQGVPDIAFAAADLRGTMDASMEEVSRELDRGNEYLARILLTQREHIPNLCRNVLPWDAIDRLQSLRLEAIRHQLTERARRGAHQTVDRLSDDFAHAIFAAMGGAA